MEKKSLLISLLKAEEKVLEATRRQYGEAFTLFHDALELFIERNNLFGNKKFDSLSKLQAARLHLMARSIKSIRTAEMAVLSGYYQQAITLLRMAAENDLVARDAAICKATLDGLLLDVPLKENDSDDIRIASFSEMAKRQSLEFKNWWDWYYGRLSIYGAHPRNASMSSLYHHNSTEQTLTLDILPFFSEDRIEPILCITASELWKMLETSDELVKDALLDKTDLDQPELNWTLEKLVTLRESLHSLGDKYIYRPEEWQEAEETCKVKTRST